MCLITHGLGMDFRFIFGVIGQHHFETGLWLLCAKQTLGTKHGEQETIVAIQVRDDGVLDLSGRNGGGKR